MLIYLRFNLHIKSRWPLIGLLCILGSNLMILIGVSAFFFYPDPNRPFFGKKTIACLENDMARYLARSGVMPVLIPDLKREAMGDFLSRLDGFVFQGGVDIAPETYRAEPLDKNRWPGDAFRDQYELKIMDYAYQNNRPVLAICRGCQLMNVYFGGTLYQDLPTELGSKEKHRDADLYDQISHPIAVSPTGLLGRIYGNAAGLQVNSVHHQGIRDLGEKLVVEATSPADGLVEAISYQNIREKFLLGVQWHPEFSHANPGQVLPPELLYDYFLNQVRRRRAV